MSDENDHGVANRKCFRCDGTGNVIDDPDAPPTARCEFCGGSGKAAANVHINSKAVFEARRRGNVFGRFVNEQLKSANRTADVTVEELEAWLLERLRLITIAELARALIDAFTMGRR